MDGQSYWDDMAPGGTLQGFLSRSSTNLRSKPKASERRSKGNSRQTNPPSAGLNKPNSDASLATPADTHKHEMQRIHDAFDTDAESIGDTTQSNVVSLRSAPVTQPELFSRSSESASNAVAPPTLSRKEDSGSSFYPEDYVDQEGSDEEVNRKGLTFLKSEEQAEWEKFNAGDFGTLGSAKKPKPNVVRHPQRNDSIPSGQNIIDHASAVHTPPRISANLDKTPIAVREKPLPAHPPRISISSRAPSHDRLSTATPTQQSFNKRTPDYSSKQLAHMSYTELANESFDHFPGFTEKILPVAISSQPLEDRLEYLLNLSGMVTENAKASMRTTYLASLPLDEFERCGQWLAQNMEASIEMQSSLRQRKRSAAHAFEKELTERMALIKRHKGRVDKDLRRLKVAGSNMVAGKALKGNGIAGKKRGAA